jgi:hypothetical protein
MNILRDALEFIKLRQDLTLHLISNTGTDIMDFVLKYNSDYLNYDYILSFGGNTEIHTGLHDPLIEMNACNFLRESQNDTIIRIELINPLGGKMILYPPSTY